MPVADSYDSECCAAFVLSPHGFPHFLLLFLVLLLVLVPLLVLVLSLHAIRPTYRN